MFRRRGIEVSEIKFSVMMKIKNRWHIAVMGACIHLLLGTVYAWSFFQNPISETYQWTQRETAWAFSISIFMLGVTAAWAGSKMNEIGVRKLACIGGILYALGYIISYFALAYTSLPLLYLGFGVIGGIGLGMAYVTPVATVASWFPDQQGLATGIVVMGFGLGAFVMSKLLAPFFLQWFDGDLAFSFLGIGIFLLLLLPLFSLFLYDNALTKDNNNDEAHRFDIKKYIFSKNYVLIWLFFSINIIAGMIFIAFQSPLLQDILMDEGQNNISILEQKGATLIAVSAICNGIGRFFWGNISDRIGKIQAFRVLFLLELVVFIVLIFSRNSALFFIGVCVILLCYGGGFGILPSLIKEQFGMKMMATMYGITLIGWGIGGIVGPQIIAMLKDQNPDEAGFYSYFLGSILITIALLFSFLVKTKKISN